MISLANRENCTGCMNCMASCNVGTISLTKDSLDNLYPIIDSSKCIECGSCVSACPALSPVELHAPIKCYAAYSTDKNIRRFSASGGV